MSFASVCILTSCLIIMGSAMLIVANLNQFVVQMQQQNEIVVFIDETATEAEVTAMGEELDEIPNISELTFVSKTEALEEYKELFQEQAVLFDSLDENNPLRDSYHLKVVDLELYSQTVNDIEQLDNVANVRVSQGIIEQAYQPAPEHFHDRDLDYPSCCCSYPCSLYPTPYASQSSRAAPRSIS